MKPMRVVHLILAFVIYLFAGAWIFNHINAWAAIAFYAIIAYYVIYQLSKGFKK